MYQQNNKPLSPVYGPKSRTITQRAAPQAYQGLCLDITWITSDLTKDRATGQMHMSHRTAPQIMQECSEELPKSCTSIDRHNKSLYPSCFKVATHTKQYLNLTVNVPQEYLAIAVGSQTYLRAASSSSCGLLVAPMTNILSFASAIT